ncbi:MAG: hypothetical protein QG656_2170 [Candidatus Hydrogenedentes bacterium]|nr:hypothetical protein [Candidatus Hydrogenedentota bacterium]
MNHPTHEEQRELVRLWETTGPELDRIRKEALRGMPYDWKSVDALLALGDSYDGPPRTSSGLVEMHRRMALAEERRKASELNKEEHP